MSREAGTRADDRIVTLLSHWLAGHVGDGEVQQELEAIGTAELQPGQAEAVDELLAKLRARDGARRGDLEMVVRETLEAVAVGDE